MKFKTKIIASGLYGAVAAAALQAAAGSILPPQPLPSLRPASGAWMRGDTHVHDDHSSDGSLLRQTVSQGAPGDLSVAMQIGEGERAGPDYMPLTDHRTYDQQYDPEWESSGLLLVPGEEANGYPHATILGSVDNVVQGAVPPGSDELRVVQESLWDAHAQGASWGTAHPDDGELNTDGSVNDYASAVGIDTIENWNRASSPDTEIDYAETRWNRGYRTGISGGSDDHFKQLWLASLDRPGTPDTAVYAIPGTIRSIVQGLWAGHTRLDSGLPATPTVSLVAEMQGSDT